MVSARINAANNAITTQNPQVRMESPLIARTTPKANPMAVRTIVIESILISFKLGSGFYVQSTCQFDENALTNGYIPFSVVAKNVGILLTIVSHFIHSKVPECASFDTSFAAITPVSTALSCLMVFVVGQPIIEVDLFADHDAQHTEVTQVDQLFQFGWITVMFKQNPSVVGQISIRVAINLFDCAVCQFNCDCAASAHCVLLCVADVCIIAGFLGPATIISPRTVIFEVPNSFRKQFQHLVNFGCSGTQVLPIVFIDLVATKEEARSRRQQIGIFCFDCLQNQITQFPQRLATHCIVAAVILAFLAVVHKPLVDCIGLTPIHGFYFDLLDTLGRNANQFGNGLCCHCIWTVFRKRPQIPFGVQIHVQTHFTFS